MAETRGQHSNNWRAQEHYGWVSLLLMLLLLAVCETAQARPGLPLLRSSYSQLQQALLNATSLASQPQSAARKLAQSGLSSIESSPDDRTESPVRQYPFNTVGLILLRFSDDSTGACTGALVGPTYVLTAGHCLVDPGTGANVVEAQFVPGYDTNSGISAPYGIAKLTDWAVPQEYLDCPFSHGYDNCHANSDIGIFSIDLSYQLWMTFSFDNADDGGEVVNTAGYPGDLNDCFDITTGGACVQYHTSCYDDEIVSGSARGEYTSSGCYSFSGQSGSPVWVYAQSGDRTIRGVHTAGSENGGTGGSFTLVTEDVFNEVLDWMSSH